MRVANNAGAKGVDNTEWWHASRRCHVMPDLQSKHAAEGMYNHGNQVKRELGCGPGRCRLAR